MGLCFVPLCNHKSQKDGCSMLTFPKSPKRLAKLKKLIRRSDCSPRKSSRICGCHFPDGKSEPSIFAWNTNKVFSPKKISPKKKCRGITARKLSFDNDGLSSGARHVEDKEREVQEDISVLKEVNDNEEIQRCLPVDAEMYVGDSQRGVPVSADLHANGNEDQSTSNIGGSEDATNLNIRIASVEEENARLLERIMILEGQLADSTSQLDQTENFLLRLKVKNLEDELSQISDIFSFKKISHSNLLVKHYTGLPNKETFFALLGLFDGFDIKYVKGWKVTRIEKEDQLFLTLVKLRRNPTNIDLGQRFKIDKTTVSNIFISWLLALHHVDFVNLMGTVPSKEKHQSDLPECFSEYPNTRIILDCTEIVTAIPTLLSNQNRMYSNYKSRITSKGLVGVGPNGTVVFLSKLYAGSSSDRKIVEDSGVLKCCVPGDNIMADKGFNIRDLLPDGVDLNIPPFKHNPQFTPEEIDETISIAAARIHVERAINRIKRFAILDYIPQTILPYATEIFQVCGALTNFQRRLIKGNDSEDDE